VGATDKREGSGVRAEVSVAVAALARELRRCEAEDDREAARSLDSRLGNLRARLKRRFFPRRASRRD